MHTYKKLKNNYILILQKIKIKLNVKKFEGMKKYYEKRRKVFGAKIIIFKEFFFFFT